MTHLSNTEKFHELKKLKSLEIQLHRENIKYILQHNTITESTKFEGYKSGVEAILHGFKFYFGVFKNNKANPTKDFNISSFSIENLLSKVNLSGLVSRFFKGKEEE